MRITNSSAGAAEGSTEVPPALLPLGSGVAPASGAWYLERSIILDIPNREGVGLVAPAARPQGLNRHPISSLRRRIAAKSTKKQRQYAAHVNNATKGRPEDFLFAPQW